MDVEVGGRIGVLEDLGGSSPLLSQMNYPNKPDS